MFSSLKISSDIEISSCSSLMSSFHMFITNVNFLKKSKLVALRLLIIFSNKSFLTNILLGWNAVFGVNYVLYFWLDESLYLSKITCQLRLLSVSKSLLLIKKYWLLFESLIISISYLWQLSIFISNNFILYQKRYFFNGTKYLIMFYFYIIPNEIFFLMAQSI